MCNSGKSKNVAGSQEKVGAVRARRFFDANAAARVGTLVVGKFVAKSEDKKCMKVEFFLGSRKCSGALHVSQFPHEEREVRDKMFEIAQPGAQTFIMKIIRVIPPTAERRLTGVHLSTLDL